MKSTSKEKKTVLVFGTFDGLHPGHKYFLESAKKFGDELKAVVARDVNVRLLKKKSSKFGEESRLKTLKESGLVDQAILGRVSISYEIIKEIKPDVIALGYDQKADLEKIAKIFSGQLVRLEAWQPDKFKSSKLN